MDDDYEINELRGHDLACWCKESPCHGDVLIEYANAPKAVKIMREEAIK